MSFESLLYVMLACLILFAVVFIGVKKILVVAKTLHRNNAGPLGSVLVLIAIAVLVGVTLVLPFGMVRAAKTLAAFEGNPNGLALLYYVPIACSIPAFFLASRSSR